MCAGPGTQAPTPVSCNETRNDRTEQLHVSLCHRHPSSLWMDTRITGSSGGHRAPEVGGWTPGSRAVQVGTAPRRWAARPLLHAGSAGVFIQQVKRQRMDLQTSLGRAALSGAWGKVFLYKPLSPLLLRPRRPPCPAAPEPPHCPRSCSVPAGTCWGLEEGFRL